MARITATTPSAIRFARSPLLLILGMLCVLGLLVLALMSSIAFGAASISFGDIWAALFHFDAQSTDHLIIRTLRIPRAVAAAVIGAALGVSGAVMQGLTRNPLADPAILGVQAGAALGVVTAVFALQISNAALYALFAFVGGALTAAVVYGVGSLGAGGTTPLKITVAGAAVSALLASITTSLLIFNQRTFEQVRFWLAGSVAGRDLSLVAQISPYLLVGFVLALALGRQITALSLGDDVAKGLGQRTGWVKILSAFASVLLACGAVAIAGPIGFVGLVIPHIARFLVGVDYRWILPYSALVGAVFLVVCDVAARLVVRPIELPVGIMTALIGGPFFVYLIRWKIKR